ncbi:MAG: hypothetical protein NC247_11290 [Ruminococcus flavefaciens]|nr:hypothetical protein [Ruminococcus flavefaciens]MCM1362851.1 hypothetical protein [Clostridiales bacterium]
MIESTEYIELNDCISMAAYHFELVCNDFLISDVIESDSVTNPVCSSEKIVTLFICKKSFIKSLFKLLPFSATIKGIQY